ncbi:hypothetical protein K440DRAFT_657333 [Wilcoxina mikolae CBS 423.85]|nr:hypothetical protein K440DRAFT_657333 [Wilcoxina mikolae CBS 423.85]
MDLAGPNGVFLHSSKSFTLSAIYISAAEAKKDFLAKVLKRPTTEPEEAIPINSWEDVLDLVDKAVAKYCEPGKLRNGMRKIGENAPAIQAWMGLFPSTSYSSTLCAGVKMVLDVATKIDKVRADVLGMLSEIPYHLGKANIYNELHKDVGSERVHEQSSKLYVVLLKAIELMLEWLKQKPLKRFGKALLKGAVNYGKEIQDIVTDIEMIAGRVAEEAVICCQHKINQVHDNVKDQNQLIKTTGTSFHNRLGEVGDQIKHAVAQLGVDVINAMHDYLAGNPKIPTEGQSPRPVASRKTFAQEVFDFIEFSPETVSEDLRICFREGQASDVMAKDRVNMVLKSPEFVGWLTKPTSSILLINGHTENAFISPMSHLCAFFGKALNSDERRVLNGIYFCGLRGKNRSCGASDLIKSLIGQLMSRFDFDFSFLKGKKRKNLNTPKELCRLLRKLLDKLPTDTVLFWIVDGVSWFESSERAEVTRTVFSKLLRMTKKCENVVVKLLITSPNRSRVVSLLCKDETVLNVPEFVDGEKQGTLAVKLEDAVGRVAIGKLG